MTETTLTALQADQLKRLKARERWFVRIYRQGEIDARLERADQIGEIISSRHEHGTNTTVPYYRVRFADGGTEEFLQWHFERLYSETIRPNA